MLTRFLFGKKIIISGSPPKISCCNNCLRAKKIYIYILFYLTIPCIACIDLGITFYDFYIGLYDFPKLPLIILDLLDVKEDLNLTHNFCSPWIIQNCMCSIRLSWILVTNIIVHSPLDNEVQNNLRIRLLFLKFDPMSYIPDCI